MTRDDLIRLADLAGYDVDEDEVHAPASGRYGLDPKLIHFAQMLTETVLSRQKAKFYQQGYEAGQRDEREACAKICDDLFLSDGNWCATAIRKRQEK